jgi:signal transduction histidine kinase
MAHEINNPVSFILLNSGIIQMPGVTSSGSWTAYGATPDLWIGGMPYISARTGIEKLLRGIREGAMRVSGIVRNLKEYAKQTPLDMTGDVDLNKALSTSLELLSTELRKATNALRVYTGPDLPHFKGDVLRIEQVLINLIQNAYQSLRDRCEGIRILTYDTGESVVFEILDQGAASPGKISIMSSTPSSPRKGTAAARTGAFGLGRHRRGTRGEPLPSHPPRARAPMWC